MKFSEQLKSGVILDNPVFMQTIGLCPTLATTTSLQNAIGMGAAATVVLICSNIVISAMRRIIPDKVRIPAYITIIAGFVTMVQMLVKAYAPDIDKALGSSGGINAGRAVARNVQRTPGAFPASHGQDYGFGPDLKQPLFSVHGCHHLVTADIHDHGV